MQLKVLAPDNPLLRQICDPITIQELRTKKIQDLIEQLLEFVYGTSNKGSKRQTNKPMTVGLSANQLGLSKRISIVDLAIGKKSYTDIHVLINPEIVWASKSQIKRTEGCVNLPTTWGEVKRSHRIKVKALDRSGNRLQFDLKGWPAILLQHEIDHLNGQLFIDHLSDPTHAYLVKKSDYRLFKKNKKNWNRFVDVSNLVRTTE